MRTIMDRYFGNVIWTNHILKRMKERGLSQQDVLWVFEHPDRTIAASSSGAYRFFRDYHGTRVEIVAKKGDDGRWILMSCWTKSFVGKARHPVGKWSFLWRIPEFIVKTLLGK